MNKKELLEEIMEELNAENVRYCVIRSYEEIPERVKNDVDILVSEADLGRFVAIVERLAVKSGWKAWLKPSRYNDYHYVLQKFQKKYEKVDVLSLDANINLVEKGVVYEIGEKVLLERVAYNNFFILSPKYELTHLLVHTAFGASTSRESYLSRIKELVEEKSPLRDGVGKWIWPISRIIQRSLEEKDIHRAVSIARKGYFFFLLKNASVLFRALEWIKKQLGRVVRRIFPPGVFVVIAGPDGVGKSTTASLLTQFIEQRYVNTDHFHFGFRPSVLPVIGRINEEKEKNKEVEERKITRIVDFVRFLYHATDYILGYWKRIRPIRVRNGIVVVERYFYDYLVRMERKNMMIPHSIAREFFNIFIPKPDVFILLENDARVIMQRRDDLSQEEIHRQTAMLKKLGERVKKFRVVRTNKSPGDVVFEIADYLFKNYEQ